MANISLEERKYEITAKENYRIIFVLYSVTNPATVSTGRAFMQITYPADNQKLLSGYVKSLK